jgi:2-oxoglutarate dehydrogenase E2 component (dihydrolipoamide succinyltransferase)
VSWSPSDAPASGRPDGAEPEGIELTVPELESAPSAMVVAWSKRIGDWVTSDEPICRLAVGELQFDVHSTAEGKLHRVFATVGASVVSGDSLAEVSAPAAQPPPDEPAPATPEPEIEAVSTAEPFYVTEPRPPLAEPPAPLAEPDLDPEPAPEPVAEQAPVLAPVAETEYEHRGDDDGGAGSQDAVDWASWHSPVVRRLAEEHDIDLSTVTGTGAGGRIRKRDVLDQI